MTPDTEAARFADMTAELHRDIYAFLDSPAGKFLTKNAAVEIAAEKRTR